MHEESRYAATASNTLDFRRIKAERRAVRPNEDVRRLASNVITYPWSGSAVRRVHAGGHGQGLGELETENTELRGRVVDLALAIMDLKDIRGR